MQAGRGEGPREQQPPSRPHRRCPTPASPRRRPPQRHRICTYHSSISAVVIDGRGLRWCQQVRRAGGPRPPRLLAERRRCWSARSAAAPRPGAQRPTTCPALLRCSAGASRTWRSLRERSELEGEREKNPASCQAGAAWRRVGAPSVPAAPQRARSPQLPLRPVATPWQPPNTGCVCVVAPQENVPPRAGGAQRAAAQAHSGARADAGARQAGGATAHAVRGRRRLPHQQQLHHHAAAGREPRRRAGLAPPCARGQRAGGVQRAVLRARHAGPRQQPHGLGPRGRRRRALLHGRGPQLPVHWHGDVGHPQPGRGRGRPARHGDGQHARRRGDQLAHAGRAGKRHGAAGAAGLVPGPGLAGGWRRAGGRGGRVAAGRAGSTAAGAACMAAACPCGL